MDKSTTIKTWGDAVKATSWDAVAAILKVICAWEFACRTDDAPPSLAHYQKMFDTLMTLEPVPTKWILHIETPTIRDRDGEPEIFVWQERPDDNPAIHRWRDGLVRWPPYTSAWKEWLGATVEAPADLTAAEIVAHGLAELAWGGFTPHAADNDFMEDEDGD